METGEDEVRARVVKWLRGEYPTRAQAKAELGINLDGLRMTTGTTF